MSSKLVKKQLGAVLAGGHPKSAGGQPASGVAGKRKPKSKKPAKKRRKAPAADPDRVREANLQYFRKTATPSEATQQLLAQVGASLLRA